MPAQSKSQQRFFGVVKAMQKGDIPKKGKAGKIAKTMSKKDGFEYSVGISLKSDLMDENIVNLKSEVKKWLTEKVNIFGLYKHEYYNEQEDFQFKVGVGVKL